MGDLMVGLVIVCFLSVVVSVLVAEGIDWLQEQHAKRKGYEEWMKGKK